MMYLLKKKLRARGRSLQNTNKGKSSPPKKATQLKKNTYNRLQGLLFEKERVKSA
jgi:hypothetical protein